MTAAGINKGVIFDLDGVLVDTGDFHKQSWNDLAEQEGFEHTDDFFYRTFGMQNYQIIPMLAGNDVSAAEIERLSEWKEQRFRDLIAGNMQLLRGVRELLDDLKERDFLLAVGSSAPKANIDFILKETKVREYFKAVVHCGDVSRGKPAPDTFLKAAEKLGLTPVCCVVVEDAVPGVAAAQAADMAVVAVTNSRSREELGKADIVVNSLAELSAGDFDKLLKNANGK